ncbi:MAG: hypothetical protein ABSH41_24500 [Syntrophobacteraceae bacterium]
MSLDNSEVIVDLLRIIEGLFIVVMLHPIDVGIEKKLLEEFCEFLTLLRGLLVPGIPQGSFRHFIEVEIITHDVEDLAFFLL